MIAQPRNRVAPTIEDVWQRYLAQEKVEEDSLYAALYNLAGFQIFETDPEKMTSLYDLVDGVTVIRWLATHQRFKTWWLR